MRDLRASAASGGQGRVRQTRAWGQSIGHSRAASVRKPWSSIHVVVDVFCQTDPGDQLKGRARSSSAASSSRPLNCSSSLTIRAQEPKAPCLRCTAQRGSVGAAQVCHTALHLEGMWCVGLSSEGWAESRHGGECGRSEGHGSSTLPENDVEIVATGIEPTRQQGTQTARGISHALMY